MFPWSKRQRRRDLVAYPFPDAWNEHLARNVRLAALLPAAEQKRLRDDLRIFVAEKDWTGCDGLEITDEVKVTISAQACVLALGVPDGYYFDHVKSIVVHPQVFSYPSQLQSGQWLVYEDYPVSGIACYGGPVVLNWKDCVWGGRHPRRGRNVVFHEFAHQLDALDGVMAGMPTEASGTRWTAIVEREFRRFTTAVRRGEATLLDHYGAFNRVEFFAVATECFFTRPAAMARCHRKLYAVLRDFYVQDPAQWPLARRPPSSPGTASS